MYPINLDITGRLCVVIGGGSVAMRKIHGLLSAGAKVLVISPELRGDKAKNLKDADWSGLAETIDWMPSEYTKGMLKEICCDECPILVFAATDSPEINEMAAAEAKEQGILVNCVTSKETCDFQVPSKVQRGDLLLTVSTGGLSPAVSKLIRRDLEKHYSPEFAQLLAVMDNLRQELKERIADTKEREKFWSKTMDEIGDELLNMVRHGDIELVEKRIRNEMEHLKGACDGTR